MAAAHDGEVIAAIVRVTREQRSDVHRAMRRPAKSIIPISGMLIISLCERANPHPRLSDVITEFAGVVPVL
jgi:hypothetical protein